MLIRRLETKHPNHATKSLNSSSPMKRVWNVRDLSWRKFPPRRQASVEIELHWNFSLFWNIFYHSGFCATCACPENRICLKFVKPWGGRPPASYAYGLWYRGWKHYILYCLENDNFKTAWISPVPTEWIVLVWLKN